MSRNLTLAILLSLFCCAITQAQEPPPVAPSPIPPLESANIIYQGRSITISPEVMDTLKPKEHRDMLLLLAVTMTVETNGKLRALIEALKGEPVDFAKSGKLTARWFDLLCEELLPRKLLKEGVKRDAKD